MQKLKVFRVEHEKTKEGPYHGTDSSLWRTRNHNYNKTTILPSNCPKLVGWLSKKDADDYIFGFPTEKSLKRWFAKKELDNLKDLGFVIKVYKVPKQNIIKGTNQLVFKP